MNSDTTNPAKNNAPMSTISFAFTCPRPFLLRVPPPTRRGGQSHRAARASCAGPATTACVLIYASNPRNARAAARSTQHRPHGPPLQRKRRPRRIRMQSHTPITNETNATICLAMHNKYTTNIMIQTVSLSRAFSLFEETAIPCAAKAEIAQYIALQCVMLLSPSGQPLPRTIGTTFAIYHAEMKKRQRALARTLRRMTMNTRTFDIAAVVIAKIAIFIMAASLIIHQFSQSHPTF